MLICRCIANVLATEGESVALTVQNGAGAGATLREALHAVGRSDITIVRAITNQVGGQHLTDVYMGIYIYVYLCIY